MGLWSFVKDAGSSLFGSQAEAPEAAAAKEEALKKEVEKLGLDAKDVSIKGDGDTVKLSGTAATPEEQEKVLRNAAVRRLKFVPKQHTEGTRAQKLITSIGGYCRSRTFLPNAPYAPGVTGVRLSQSELEKLQGRTKPLGEHGDLLKRVLSECIAENLLVLRPSSASTARDAGSILYLNRTLCARFGLPLQMGGWQDVTCTELIEWMLRGWKPKKSLAMEI